VFVDLLTYADLEMLKARKEKAGGGGAGGGFQRALPPNNKRYLILTYAAEFDRVHFPLPLLYEDAPDPAALKRTIAELRSELEGVQGDGAEGAGVSQELRRLRAENGSLRDKLSDAERANGGGGFGPEVQRLTAVAKEAERELRLVSLPPQTSTQTYANTHTNTHTHTHTHTHTRIHYFWLLYGKGRMHRGSI
jgi:coiled-coil domain-containing protein 61